MSKENSNTATNNKAPGTQKRETGQSVKNENSIKPEKELEQRLKEGLIQEFFDDEVKLLVQKFFDGEINEETFKEQYLPFVKREHQHSESSEIDRMVAITIKNIKGEKKLLKELLDVTKREEEEYESMINRIEKEIKKTQEENDVLISKITKTQEENDVLISKITNKAQSDREFINHTHQSIMDKTYKKYSNYSPVNYLKFNQKKEIPQHETVTIKSPNKFNTNTIEPLKYVYVLGETPVNVEVLNDRKQIPLLLKEKMRQFPQNNGGWANAVTTAAEEANKHCNKSEIFLVYKCLDMQKNRQESSLPFNVDTRAYFGEVTSLNIVEVQPVCSEDFNKVERQFNRGKVTGDLKHKSFQFVPLPLFKNPRDNRELILNIKLYLLYRTGEERGKIAYLRNFGPFKGYSVSQKKKAAKNLLKALEDPNFHLSKEDLNTLKNGNLNRATQGFETILKRQKNIRINFSV